MEDVEEQSPRHHPMEIEQGKTTHPNFLHWVPLDDMSKSMSAKCMSAKCMGAKCMGAKLFAYKHV